MKRFTSSQPTLSKIRTEQDVERNIRRQLAKHHYYKIGNRWHFSGSAIAIAFALVAPVVLLFKPSQGPLLGAIAGVWVFMSRLAFEPLKNRYQHRGATAQELFDCDVLGLTWNSALTQIPADEDIRSASKSARKPEIVAKNKGWYAADVEMAWPASVLTCQRSNAVWGRRQHQSYGIFLLMAAGVWTIFGITLALARDTSLAEYLTTIALPSLPALLDAIELAKRHLITSRRRLQIEQGVDALLDDGQANHEALREIQDEVFALRRDAPPVAGWFYKILKSSYEENMRYAVEEQSRRSS